MSQRPRLAGDGRLLVPAKVVYDDQGHIHGRFAPTTVDPFDWTQDRLLLAESFARLDLGVQEMVEGWMSSHGALDAFDPTGRDEARADDDEWVERGPADASAARRAEETDEQGKVRWLLATLVRLSDNRHARAWDPAWADLRLAPQHPDTDDSAEIAAGGAEPLGATWESTLELMRRLVEPYVARAVERVFRIELVPREDGRRVLVPLEGRQWRSILAPIYLQIFEALRRTSEGEPGAATCRECGQPFLVLDARRRFFCNDRERFRYAQRKRRRRLSTEAKQHDPVTDEMVENLERRLRDADKVEQPIRTADTSQGSSLAPPVANKARARRRPS